MQFEITHFTRYAYDREVWFMPHLLYLRPRENPLLAVNRFAFHFIPSAKVYWMRDDFDNLPTCAYFSAPSKVLEIRSECEVTTMDTAPFDFLVRDYALTFPFAYEPLHCFNLSIYRTPPDDGEQAVLREWLETHFGNPPRETVGWIFQLTQLLHRHLRYERREDAGIQPALTTLARGSGSCRDYAVLWVALARTSGLAARFVSGYLFDPVVNGSMPGDMHAWAEVFLPGAGWRGVDPTNGVFCHNGYVPVAHAVVAESVNPIQGAFTSDPPAAALLTSDVRVRQRGLGG
jgi:transglutaminase-like putative cysteine protease